LPVNKFTVLTIEDPNTIDSELVDAPPSIPLVLAPLHKPKWEKRLPKLFLISTLDARGTSLLLPVEIGTTDMSELHSVKALLDCRATGSLIDRDFVRSKGMNTQTLSHNIPIFNVDSSPNEAEQISEVVDIVLRYKTHSERMLLVVSRLGKQSLILGYDWLKDHNPRIDWEKGEVEMTRCPSGVSKDVPYGRNRLARRGLNSEPFNLVMTDPHPCSRKSQSLRRSLHKYTT